MPEVHAEGEEAAQLWRYTGMLERMAEKVDQFVAPSRFTAGMHAERGFSRSVEHLPNFIERVDDEWQSPGPRPQGDAVLFVLWDGWN